jgi:hypothetical protein
VGAELLHAEGRKDRWSDMKLVVVFRGFAKAPKITKQKALMRMWKSDKSLSCVLLAYRKSNQNFNSLAAMKAPSKRETKKRYLKHKQGTIFLHDRIIHSPVSQSATGP